MKKSTCHSQSTRTAEILRDAEKCGNAYLPVSDLVNRCCQCTNLRMKEVQPELERLLRDGHLYLDDHERIYAPQTYRYELATAHFLAQRLSNNLVPLPPTMDAVLAAVEPFLDVPLSQEQNNAIRTCQRHPFSIVTGGAGCGKTTLIRALWLAQRILAPSETTLLVAPTGKAARNLRERTRHGAHTVHRALGKTPCDNFLDNRAFRSFWDSVDMVVVDEASMLTLEMLAGLLEHAKPDCRIVLVGDPNQLPSVGAGNVLNDLIALGTPCIHLISNHRQKENGGALLKNVMTFPEENCTTLEFDESFHLIKAYSEPTAQEVISNLYLQALEAGEDVQILSPFRGFSAAGAAGLSRAIQEQVNPQQEDKCEHELGRTVYRDGDRVILTKNTDSACNGDIGYLRYELSSDGYLENIFVEFTFGRLNLGSYSNLALLDLAYAITIHKAQGSEYETVIVPILREFSVMLTRNLFYTAISRARKKLILVGDEGALDKALTSIPAPRNSALVERVCTELRKKEVFIL